MDRSELELRYETMLEEYPDTKIIFSEGAAEQFAELMNAEKASSVVIFTGSSKGAAAKAMPNLQNLMAYMNLDFRFYMDIPAEPAVTDVRDMVRMLEEEKPQFVAALGGGSVMDAAKAAYLSSFNATGRASAISRIDSFPQSMLCGWADGAFLFKMLSME